MIGVQEARFQLWIRLQLLSVRATALVLKPDGHWEHRVRESAGTWLRKNVSVCCATWTTATSKSFFFSFNTPLCWRDGNRASVVRRCHYEPTAINYCSWYRGCEGFVCLLGRNNNVLDEYSSNVSSSVLLLFTHCTMDIIAGKKSSFLKFLQVFGFSFF